MQMLAQDSLGARNKFRAYWLALVRYFQRYPTDKLVYELINEPYSNDPKNHQFMYALQDSLVQDIRRIDTVHWIAVAGRRNDKMMDGLVDSLPGIPYRDERKSITFPPIPAKKLIYTFHWYQPDVLIFQGLKSANLWGCTGHLPYPAYTGCADSLIASGCGNYGSVVQWQIYETARPYQVQALPLWGRHRMDSLIRQAANYGQEHQVPIWMGEGMCFARPNGIDRDSRIRYMTDLVDILRSDHIGFSLWDPSGAAVQLVKGRMDQPSFDTLLLTKMGFFTQSPVSAATPHKGKPSLSEKKTGTRQTENRALDSPVSAQATGRKRSPAPENP
jgi:hypothetical protein